MRKVNLIPMAGLGQRFIDEGYTIPKPMIEIDGIPMVVRAADSLPAADQWIFICNERHLTEYKIDEKLRTYFPDSIIISIDYLTEGQASTCLLAEPYLRSNDILSIGACDNSMVYDENRFWNKQNQQDVLVWTFRNNLAVKRNPGMYGYVDVNRIGGASRVSCKTPISAQPEKDHAIVGTFSFKKAEDFIINTNIMIAKNRRINNEFYVDVVIDECIKNGLNVHPFEVDKYSCWGTPSDLEKYKIEKHIK